jgi:hypothetical protein
MLQKIDFKQMPLVVKGSGRVDETRPIDLLEYVTPYDSTRKDSFQVQAIPMKMSFSMKVGNTIYDVSTCFDTEGKQTMLQQFKNLILSEKLIEPQV